MSTDPAEELADELLAGYPDIGSLYGGVYWTRTTLLAAIRRHYGACPTCGFPLNQKDEKRLRSAIDRHAKPARKKGRKA